MLMLDWVPDYISSLAGAPYCPSFHFGLAHWGKRHSLTHRFYSAPRLTRHGWSAQSVADLVQEQHR